MGRDTRGSDDGAAAAEGWDYSGKGMLTMNDTETRKDTINQRIECAIKQLRTIRKLTIGTCCTVTDDHFTELADLVASIRHNVQMLKEGNDNEDGI